MKRTKTLVAVLLSTALAIVLGSAAAEAAPVVHAAPAAHSAATPLAPLYSGSYSIQQSGASVWLGTPASNGQNLFWYAHNSSNVWFDYKSKVANGVTWYMWRDTLSGGCAEWYLKTGSPGYVISAACNSTVSSQWWNSSYYPGTRDVVMSDLHDGFQVKTLTGDSQGYATMSSTEYIALQFNSLG